MGCSLPGSSVHRDPLAKNTGVGCHALLQRSLPNRGSNPGLQHCRWILYLLSYQGSPRWHVVQRKIPQKVTVIKTPRIILLICLQRKERGKMLVAFSPSLVLIWRYIWVIKVLLHYILWVASTGTLENWLLSFKGTPEDLSSNCLGNSKSLKALYFLSPKWILCHKNLHLWVSLVAHW